MNRVIVDWKVDWVHPYDLQYMKGIGNKFSGRASYNYQHHPKILDYEKLVSDAHSVAKDLSKIEVDDDNLGALQDCIDKLSSFSTEETTEYVSMMEEMEEDWNLNHETVCKAITSLNEARLNATPDNFRDYLQEIQYELEGILPQDRSFSSLENEGHLSRPLSEVVRSLDLEGVQLRYDIIAGADGRNRYHAKVGNIAISFTGDKLAFTLPDASQFIFQRGQVEYVGNVQRHSLSMMDRNEHFVDWMNPTQDEINLLGFLRSKNYLDISILQKAFEKERKSI